MDIEGLKQAANSVELPLQLNKYIMAETASDNEDKIRLEALQKKRMRIQDTLSYMNERLIVDSKRFVVYLYDRQSCVDFKPEVDYKKIGNFFSSVIWANKFLGGCLDLRKDNLTNNVKYRPCKEIQCDLLTGKSETIVKQVVEAKKEKDAASPASYSHASKQKEAADSNSQPDNVAKKLMKEME